MKRSYLSMGIISCLGTMGICYMCIRNTAGRTGDYIYSVSVILTKFSLNQVKIYSLMTFEKKHEFILGK